MSTRAPLVSVVMPTFNRGGFIAETLDSILAQDHPAVEVIVVDDGSTDDTTSVLAAFGQRIRVIRQRNLGQAVAVNRGLAATFGEYVTLVSDDDPVLPGALSRLVEVLEEDLDALVAYPNSHTIDSNGEPIAVITNLEYSLADMARHHLCYPGPCSVFRRRVLDLVGGWDTRWRWVADYDFWLRIGLHGRMVCVPEILATWRYHLAGASLGSPRIAMAHEQVAVTEAFFARSDLPDDVRAVEAEALASAYVIGALFALQGTTAAGVSRFEILDRLARHVEHRLPAANGSALDQPATTVVRQQQRIEELERTVDHLRSDRETLQRHVEALERNLELLNRSKVQPSHDE